MGEFLSSLDQSVDKSDEGEEEGSDGSARVAPISSALMTCAISHTGATSSVGADIAVHGSDVGTEIVQYVNGNLNKMTTLSVIIITDQTFSRTYLFTLMTA